MRKTDRKQNCPNPQKIPDRSQPADASGVIQSKPPDNYLYSESQNLEALLDAPCSVFASPRRTFFGSRECPTLSPGIGVDLYPVRVAFGPGFDLQFQGEIVLGKIMVIIRIQLPNDGACSPEFSQRDLESL